MRLASISIEGYRRFLNKSTLKTSSKMTVLIGPNEAGKSSIINLLTLFNSEKAFSAADRYKFKDSVKIAASATFHLEAEDHEAIGSKTPQRFVINKQNSGKLLYRIEPKMNKPKAHRASFKKKISRILRNRDFQKQYKSTIYRIEEMCNLAERLDLEKESYSEAEISFIDELLALSDSLDFSKLPKYVNQLAQEIRSFLHIERTDFGNETALKILKGRAPKFVEFTNKDRQLKPAYNLAFYEHSDRKRRQKPCNALANICEIVGLDLAQLKKYLIANSSDRIQARIDNANRKLKQLFDEAWSQSDISVFLAWHKPEIQMMVQIRGQENLEYSLIEERSDGLRQSVALLAFVIKEDAHRPILLIDEAEQHLHYDAQADLVQTFTERNLASQVIYSTHSAGCLPEDLGVGVRLVVPIENDQEIATSRIDNNFWSTDALGFYPLLYGMGAQTLAFFPTRKALVCEGQSEMLLLPTIFRQAGDREFNGFQIVPGLASIPRQKLRELSFQGAKVAYLLDNDRAGQEYYSSLKAIGVSKTKLFYISGHRNSAISVEDWIEDNVFFEAMKKYRLRYFPNAKQVNKKYYYGDGKAAKVKEYEKRESVSVSKTVLAYIILEISEASAHNKIYNIRHKSAINRICREVCQALE